MSECKDDAPIGLEEYATSRDVAIDGSDTLLELLKKHHGDKDGNPPWTVAKPTISIPTHFDRQTSGGVRSNMDWV